MTRVATQFVCDICGDGFSTRSKARRTRLRRAPGSASMTPAIDRPQCLRSLTRHGRVERHSSGHVVGVKPRPRPTSANRLELTTGGRSGPVESVLGGPRPRRDPLASNRSSTPQGRSVTSGTAIACIASSERCAVGLSRRGYKLVSETPAVGPMYARLERKYARLPARAPVSSITDRRDRRPSRPARTTGASYRASDRTPSR